MTGFFADVARASLPVGIALLAFAAATRAVQVARPDDARLQRLAALYLQPSSVWALGAIAIHALALLVAGDAGLASLGISVALALGAVAVLLWPAGSSEPVADASPPDSQTPAPAPPRASPAGPLWARPANEASTRHR